MPSLVKIGSKAQRLRVETFEKCIIDQYFDIISALKGGNITEAVCPLNMKFREDENVKSLQ